MFFVQMTTSDSKPCKMRIWYHLPNYKKHKVRICALLTDGEREVRFERATVG